MGDTPFPGWSSCTYLEYDDDNYVSTDYFTVDYVSTYPSLGTGNYVDLTSPVEYCSMSDNVNYNSYFIIPLTEIWPINSCQPFGDGSPYSYVISTTSCGKEGESPC